MGELIAFDISDLENKIAVRFCRELYGYTDKSNFGKYKYKRSGLLNEIPYVKLIRGVIIVRKRDANKVIKLLKKFDAEYHVRIVELTKKDQEILSK